MRRCEAGQAVVEFALTVPVLLLLLIGLVDMGRGFQAYTSLGNAVREAAREAAVHGADASVKWGPAANDANVVTAVRKRISGIPTQDVAVTSQWPSGSNAAGKEVVVGATYAFRPIAFALLGGWGVTLSATTRARVRY